MLPITKSPLDGGSHGGIDVRVKRRAPDVVRRKFCCFRHVGNSSASSDFNLLGDALRPSVEYSSKDARKGQDVVYLLRLAAPARGLAEATN